MKTTTIIAIVLGSLVLLSWVLIHGIKFTPNDSSLNTHPSNFVKSPIEMQIKIKQEKENDDKTVNYMDYAAPEGKA